MKRYFVNITKVQETLIEVLEDEVLEWQDPETAAFEIAQLLTDHDWDNTEYSVELIGEKQ